MEIELQENDYKGGWDFCSFAYLVSRLIGEAGELLRALQFGEDSTVVTSEAAGVANFAMMIADNYLRLEKESEDATD